MNLSFSFHCSTIDEFITRWSSAYSYDAEWKYETNIGKPLTEQSRMELFEWKNGGKLSQAKQKSVEANYPLVFLGNCIERYLNPRASGGEIWNIFYLHCVDPQEWPIFDQHVFRAMVYMKTGKIEEIEAATQPKCEIYQGEYIPFFKSLPNHSGRRTDKALVTFGSFLKTARKFL